MNNESENCVYVIALQTICARIPSYQPFERYRLPGARFEIALKLPRVFFRFYSDIRFQRRR